MKILGLDIGTNSVGSAWVDFDKNQFSLATSVFPAGVEDSDKGRGDPKNQARRNNRSQRKSIRRRAIRKRKLQQALQEWGWMPSAADAQQQWFELNPWFLRRDALSRELSPHEFGRILLHLVQRRGAAWFDEEETQTSGATKGPKAASDVLLVEMKNCNAETYGQFMADLLNSNTQSPATTEPIRNRNTAEGNTDYKYFPQRQLLRDEFEKIWKIQRNFDSPLAPQLTQERHDALSNSARTDTWKFRGLLWGQRNTYWDTGTLGRCELEPADHPCPQADMYAQEFLLLQEINNIRINTKNTLPRPLNEDERILVSDALIKTKKPTSATVRKSLGLHKQEFKNTVHLNIEHDTKKALNSNWFAREIVNALGEDQWNNMDFKLKKSINRAICKFDPRETEHVEKFSKGASKWWCLDESQTQALIKAWKTRPAPEKRTSLSRKAIQNLLPYMRQGLSVTEARQTFAEDGSHDASLQQRTRYALGMRQPNHATRHFLKKHPDLLPPAPMIANPVVRKAIHEVRKHVSAHIKRYGCKPDRVIIELARDAKISKKQAESIYSNNKERRDEREKIRKDFANVFEGKSTRWINKAIDRVLLCKAQKEICAYSNLDSDSPRVITQRQAAEGTSLEIDHLFPQSRGGRNSLSNKVLCYAASNRSKGNQSPKEWLNENEFATMQQRFSYWNSPGASKQDHQRWKVLNKDSKDLELDEFMQSQLTDTAYASRQLTQWLDEVLYGNAPADIPGKKCKVFATNGRYTSLLRHQWGLYFDQRDENINEKSRADHRHHAIDALVIACSGPDRIQKIVAEFKKQEQNRGNSEQFTIPTPWGNHDSFRAQAIDQIKNLVVSHRPERRKLVGRFHKETMYGPMLDNDGNLTENFTQKIFLSDLAPSHLRMPELWDTYYEKYNTAKTKKAKSELRKQMDHLPDVNSGRGNPGIVNNRWNRYLLRTILIQNGVNPDKFTKNDIRQLIRDGKFRLPSGVPIKHVKLRKTFNNTVVIPRKTSDGLSYESNPRSLRVYDSQSNHHIEIRENSKGKWNGQVITTFEVVQRIKPAKASGQTKQPMIDKAQNENGQFVMSLAVGETIFMKHPKIDEDGYYCVFRLEYNGAKIHLTPHWDAGKSKADDKFPAREDISLSPQQLQKLAPQGYSIPQKIWVSPLGEVKFLHDD